MNIFGIFAVGIVSLVLIMTIKKDSPVTATFISITSGIVILFMLMPRLAECFTAIKGAALGAEVNKGYADTIIKITVISYLAEFCSQLCTDSGQTSIGSKIELGAKVFIISASMPIVMALVKAIGALMP